MSGRIADCRLFFQEFRRNFHTTGALLPSGRRLAFKLAHFVDRRSDARSTRILEVGPGTGAVTRHIIRRMRPADKLDLVEINENFATFLNEQFRDDPEFRPVGARATVHATRIEDLRADSPYDVIISGLPLNNFTAAEVEGVLTTLRRLCASGGTVTFFQYMGIRRVKAAISGPSERARLRGIGQVLKKALESHEIRRDWVWQNVPPAWVHHLQF
jgi:phosphatidylethanolamine/phosphatidyl-N-methylethanolamine N-methyltransferase